MSDLVHPTATLARITPKMPLPRCRKTALELHVILKGQGLYIVNGHRYELTSQSMVWVFADQERWVVDRSRDFAMWMATFSNTLSDNMLRCSNHPVLEMPTSSKPILRRVPQELIVPLHGLATSLHSSQHDRDRFQIGLAWLMFECWRASEAGQEVGPGIPIHPAVTSCLRRLDAFPEDDDLTSLADTVGLSPCRLSRLFGQQITVSLVDYRQRIRLEWMRERMATSVCNTLKELSLQAGFGSYAQFHRACRRHLGCNPRQAFSAPNR